jgi:hypothetical protein
MAGKGRSRSIPSPARNSAGQRREVSEDWRDKPAAVAVLALTRTTWYLRRLWLGQTVW